MRLSVIIPVHNGGEDLRRCLEALQASLDAPDEVIVVDDASSDASAALARAMGMRVLAIAGGPLGPAKARNEGAAAANGDILMFVDADVAVHADAIGLVRQYMVEQPDVAAVFGSYDDDPAQPGLVTRYKNLLHHYVHQHSRQEASTFWAGCGAIRRDVFAEIGGFNTGYRRPAIEDIELGVRLRRDGYRVWLAHDILGKHLKRWTLGRMLRSDIVDRAIPWTQLILSGTPLPRDLNLDNASRLSAAAAWAVIVLLVLGAWSALLWLGAAAAAAVVLVLNRDLYSFFARRGGVGFAIGAAGLHVLYLLYSSLVFGGLLARHVLDRIARRIAGSDSPDSSRAATRAGRTDSTEKEI